MSYQEALEMDSIYTILILVLMNIEILNVIAFMNLL